MKMNLRIFTTVAAIVLSGASLASCVSDVDGYDRGPRFHQRWDNDGPRREWGHDRPSRHNWDRGDRPDRRGWRGRDDRRNDGDDRGRHRRWMQDDG